MADTKISALSAYTGASVTTSTDVIPIVDTANTQTKKILVTQLQIALRGIGMSQVTNSLGSDVNLNNTSNYFDGPSVAQGTSGVWFASGSVTVHDTAGLADFQAKLWDGTTVIASGSVRGSAANERKVIALSGFISSPAANIRISVKDASSTSGVMLFNQSGNSADSTVSAIRIG